MEPSTITAPESKRYAGWDDGVSPGPPATVLSPYENRVALVTDVLTRNSLTSAAEARRLAIDVLAAIDHIPEKVR